MTVATEYQAKRILLARVKTSVAMGFDGALDQSDADEIFAEMTALYPVGSRVSATYFKSIFDKESVTVEGVVEYSANLQDDEPLFEIRHSGDELVMLRGSLLTPLP